MRCGFRQASHKIQVQEAMHSFRCCSPASLGGGKRPAAGVAARKPSRTLAAGRRPSRALAVSPMAMVNVDFTSPSLVLGAALIGCGVLLLQVGGTQCVLHGHGAWARRACDGAQ